MMFAIEFTEDAKRQISKVSARDRSMLLDAIEEQLSDQANVVTRNRKQLRTSALAGWELRVGKYRVVYKVHDEEVLVLIIAIGKKDHNTLTIDGKEIKL